jgi:hypothetical protein
MRKQQLSIYGIDNLSSTHQIVVQEVSRNVHASSHRFQPAVRSISRQLTGAFVTQWKSFHPNGKVIDRDLNAAVISPISAEWVGAAYTPDEARTPQQKELLGAFGDTYRRTGACRRVRFRRADA